MPTIPKLASGRAFFDVGSGHYHSEKVPAGVWSVAVAKKSGLVVKKNAGASLVDIGDGVGCIEFHSKMNSLGGDIVQMITQTLKPGGAGDNFDAFVITNDAANFSVGANIMMLLMAVQEEEWDEVDLAIRQFQGMTQAIKFSSKPVVVAPFGMTLGGGTEITLHAAARQPHAELYAGLVEVGVGLLPGGGGCKEMTLRAIDKATHIRPAGRGESVEMMEAMKQAFETVAMAKVSTSAFEARNLGFLSTGDDITMNRERVLTDAKERALELVHEGYRAPVPRNDIPAPGESILATLKLGVHIMHEGEFITDHEVKIGNKVAEVLCGGVRESRHAGERAVSARPGARGVQVALRREEDARADPVHVEDGEDAEELVANGQRGKAIAIESTGRHPAAGAGRLAIRSHQR